jgi:hypothetical protein
MFLAVLGKFPDSTMKTLIVLLENKSYQYSIYDVFFYNKFSKFPDFIMKKLITVLENKPYQGIILIFKFPYIEI